MNQSERIGSRIRAAREAKKMTQEKLAERLGVSPQAVSTWETGNILPDTDHLLALAGELDLSLDALLTGLWTLAALLRAALRIRA